LSVTPQLTIIFERGESGWWVATIPEVPGAFSQGRTREEARENVLDALTELMAARRELALRERSPGAELENLPIGATAQ
jgi:predicted RNase H-like HicB family nuclease